MSTTAIAAPSIGLTRSRRILIGLALFSIAGAGVITVAPAIAVQQGSGGQPSFEIVAGTGAALILLAGLLLAYVGRVLGLGGAWLLMAVVSNGSLLVYRFVVVPVSMYKTTFYLEWFKPDPNQPGILLGTAVASALALVATVVVARFLFGDPHIPSDSAKHRRLRRSVVLPFVIALGVALPFIGVLLLEAAFGAMFELGTVVTITGAFLPCWLGAIWLAATPGAFAAASWRAGEVRDVTVVTAFLWVALALLLVVHILWVVYMGVLAHLLPFKTVTPGK